MRWLASIVLVAAIGCERKTYVPSEPLRKVLPAPPEGPALTHGPMVGEVGTDHALVWARADRAGQLRVEVVDPPGGSVTTADVATDRDFVAKVALEGLQPDTAYRLEVRFVDPVPGPAATVTFRTAPPPDAARPVRFAIGGDMAGQNACRHPEQGFAILRHVDPSSAFFVGLGDMIYADGTCEAKGAWGQPQLPGGFGPAADRASFWAHWRYAWGDPGARDLFRRMGYFAVWDDHETVNNAGPHHDTRSQPPYVAGQPLLPIARQALEDYNPVADGARLYRRVRWGKHVELFLLDTRSYRDDNRAADDGDAPKTMLGAAQRAWLVDGLSGSDATWRFVVSSVPMGIPTGTESERDSWPDAGGDLGFERELLDILAAVRDRHPRPAGEPERLVWLATDVHFATVMRHRPLSDVEILEVVCGPLSAKLFPNRTLDETMKTERLFFHGPKNIDAVKSYDEALGWYNYGLVDVAEDGALTLSIVDGRGEERWRQRLDPPARRP